MFVEPTRKMLKRSAHKSVAALHAGIETWNDNPKPFVWHKTADEIPAKLKKYVTDL